MTQIRVKKPTSNMSEDEIMDIIKGWNTANILDKNSFIKENDKLNNFKVHQISAAMPIDSNPLGLDTDQLVVNILKNGIVRDINKQICLNLFSSKYFDYLDLTSSDGLQHYTDTRRLYNLICNCKVDYTNLLTTCMVAGALQDLAEFSIVPVTDLLKSSGGNIYHVGKLPGLDIWVDPYMNYNDGRLVLFKNTESNITDVVPSIQNGSTFAPRLMINYKLDYSVSDSKVIFILDNNSSETFRQYKSLQRDIKIDDILG